MTTREQCLDEAAYCARLADDCSTPASRRMLLQAAEHWRSLAQSLTLDRPTRADDASPISALDDPILTKMLSDVGALIR